MDFLHCELPPSRECNILTAPTKFTEASKTAVGTSTLRSAESMQWLVIRWPLLYRWNSMYFGKILPNFRMLPKSEHVLKDMV